VFFFEKKNQKTFVDLGRSARSETVRSDSEKSFLLLFFKKDAFSLYFVWF